MTYQIIQHPMSMVTIIHYAGLGYVLAVAVIVWFFMGVSKVNR